MGKLERYAMKPLSSMPNGSAIFANRRPAGISARMKAMGEI